MTKEELKPMDLGAILDKTFRMTFSNMKKYLKVFLMYFGVIFGITVFITAIIIGFLIAAGFTFDDFGQPEILAPFLLTIIPVSTIAIILIIFIVIIFNGMIYDIFAKSFIGEDWNFKSSFKFIKSKFWTIFLASILGFFILIGGYLMCCIGVLPMLAFVSLILPAIICENKNSTGAISRSFKLVSYSFWKVFGSILLFMIIVGALSFIFQIGFQALPFLFQTLDNDNNIRMIIFISIFTVILYILYLAYSILATALSSAFYVLIFYNQKIKHENFGVEFLADSIAVDQPSATESKKE